MYQAEQTARRSNQSILKISPECSLEGLMLKLKLLYFGHLSKELTHLKRLWCWEGLGAGGEGDDRGWDGWMASLTLLTWVWVNSWVGDGQGGLACCNSWDHKESDMTERLNWFTRLLILLMVSIAVQKLWSFIRPHLFVFAFISFALGDRSKKYCFDVCRRMFWLCSLLVV